jgi:hypothetical protein
MAEMAGRTGLPVRVALALSRLRSRATSSNEMAMDPAMGASSRLARPRTAFCSWIRVGRRRHRAASMVGTLA